MLKTRMYFSPFQESREWLHAKLMFLDPLMLSIFFEIYTCSKRYYYTHNSIKNIKHLKILQNLNLKTFDFQ
jgi:hypothetical protein